MGLDENGKNEEENLGDIVNKFSEILKDKDINLGEIFEKSNEENKENEQDFNIDFETLLKLKDLIIRETAFFIH